MASACMNNIAMSPEKFLDAPVSCKSCGWLSPRISFGREMSNDDASRSTGLKKPPPPAKIISDPPEDTDLEVREVSAAEFGGFEFRQENPVDMLTADELFSDGKLIPLHLSMMSPAAFPSAPSGNRSPDTHKSHRGTDILGNDPHLFSPKAPRCSSRWKELLGLRKLYQNSNAKQDNQKTTPSVPSQSTNGAKSIRHFLHRSSKSSDSSLILPLLKEIDSESFSIPSRLSLSSSSSGHDHDDVPRLSLDSDKPTKFTVTNSNPPRVKLVKKPRAALTDNGPLMGRSPMRRPAETTATTSRGVSIDSPRMNSSGKIIFHSLERSSSSPSSFNGGPRLKHRGMERSYSANVRITPVLNVPVCSLRGSSKSGGVFGFPIFTSQQKREAGGGSAGGSVNGSSGGANRSQQSNGKNRTERT